MHKIKIVTLQYWARAGSRLANQERRSTAFACRRGTFFCWPKRKYPKKTAFLVTSNPLKERAVPSPFSDSPSMARSENGRHPWRPPSGCPDGFTTGGPWKVKIQGRFLVSFLDILRTAILALRGNWMRSALTSLGVIIGIAAVIVMVSVGQGTQAEIDKLVSGLGSQRLDVSPGAGRGGGGARMSASSFFTLNEGDAEAIRSEIP